MPTDIIKNVENQGYTPQNRRDLRKCRAFDQVATDFGYSFVHDDGNIRVTVDEYVSEERMALRTGQPSSNLVPHDDMATQQHTVRMPAAVDESRTRLYYEADPAVLEQVDAHLAENPAYERTGRREQRYRDGGTVISLDTTRGQMTVFTSGELSPDPVDIEQEIWGEIELQEMLVLARDGSEGLEQQFYAEKDDFTALDSMR